MLFVRYALSPVLMSLVLASCTPQPTQDQIHHPGPEQPRKMLLFQPYCFEALHKTLAPTVGHHWIRHWGP